MTAPGALAWVMACGLAHGEDWPPGASLHARHLEAVGGAEAVLALPGLVLLSLLVGVALAQEAPARSGLVFEEIPVPGTIQAPELQILVPRAPVSPPEADAPVEDLVQRIVASVDEAPF